MRPRSHEELVEFGERFIGICEMKINAIKLEKEYYNLLANKEKKFNEKLYVKIMQCIANHIEPDVNRLSIEFGETIQTTEEVVKVTKGRGEAVRLRRAANQIEESMVLRDRNLNSAYLDGVVSGLKEHGLTIDDIDI